METGAIGFDGPLGSIEQMDEVQFRRFVGENLQALRQHIQRVETHHIQRVETQHIQRVETAHQGSLFGELIHAHEQLKAANAAKEGLVRELSRVKKDYQLRDVDMENAYKKFEEEFREKAARRADRSQQKEEPLDDEKRITHQGCKLIHRVILGNTLAAVVGLVPAWVAARASVQSSWCKLRLLRRALALVGVLVGNFILSHRVDTLAKDWLQRLKMGQDWWHNQLQLERQRTKDLRTRTRMLEQRSKVLDDNLQEARSRLEAFQAQFDLELSQASHPQLQDQILTLTVANHTLKAQLRSVHEMHMTAMQIRQESTTQTNHLAATTTALFENLANTTAERFQRTSTQISQLTASTQQLADTTDERDQRTRENISQLARYTGKHAALTDARIGHLADATGRLADATSMGLHLVDAGLRGFQDTCAQAFQQAVGTIGHIAAGGSEELQRTNARIDRLEDVPANVWQFNVDLHQESHSSCSSRSSTVVNNNTSHNYPLSNLSATGISSSIGSPSLAVG